MVFPEQIFAVSQKIMFWKKLFNRKIFSKIFVIKKVILIFGVRWPKVIMLEYEMSRTNAIWSPYPTKMLPHSGLYMSIQLLLLSTLNAPQKCYFTQAKVLFLLFIELYFLLRAVSHVAGLLGRQPTTKQLTTRWMCSHVVDLSPTQSTKMQKKNTKKKWEKHLPVKIKHWLTRNWLDVWTLHITTYTKWWQSITHARLGLQSWPEGAVFHSLIRELVGLWKLPYLSPFLFP